LQAVANPLWVSLKLSLAISVVQFSSLQVLPFALWLVSNMISWVFHNDEEV
jgi:hypothetical protein